jgi:hypothetical protein
MKTQIALDSYNSGFFLVSPVKAVQSHRMNGGSRVSSRVSSEPIAAKRILTGEPARRGNSGLPTSLEDWLVCSKALEITQKDCDGTNDGNDAWVMAAKPATRAKNPPTVSMRL